MLRTGIETIICLSPNFLYVYVYVYVKTARLKDKVTIAQHEVIRSICNGTMFGDVQWPGNALHRFISITWYSCRNYDTQECNNNEKNIRVIVICHDCYTFRLFCIFGLQKYHMLYVSYVTVILSTKFINFLYILSANKLKIKNVLVI